MIALVLGRAEFITHKEVRYIIVKVEMLFALYLKIWCLVLAYFLHFPILSNTEPNANSSTVGCIIILI